jgi:PAS domain S-box-containing protein
MYELITSACKILDTFGLPRAIGNLQTDRFIVANNSFLRIVGLEKEELSSIPLSEIVKTPAEPLDSAKAGGGLVPITIRGSENGRTIAGHAALGRNSLVFLIISTAVDPSPDFELGAVFGEEVERQKMAVYLHKNLAPEFMAAVFSIESVRLQLEKENHPYEAQLRGVQERITESLHHMREELERSETVRREFYLMSRHLAAIVENSDDAIIGKDLNSVITSWNKGAERIFGYSAEEMIGNSIRRIIPPDRQEEEDEILARLRRGERCDHFETVRLTKEGSRLYVSLTISPIKDESGKVVGASKIARDITERKLAEEALREAKTKVAAGKMKSEPSGETGTSSETLSRATQSQGQGEQNVWVLSLETPLA